MGELFGLEISEGAISNAFQRLADPLKKARTAIRAALREARIIASDETTTRIGGITHWQWVFVSDRAVLHEIAPRRAKAVAEGVLGGHRPDVWISDRYGGQQNEVGEFRSEVQHLGQIWYLSDAQGETVSPCRTIRISPLVREIRSPL